MIRALSAVLAVLVVLAAGCGGGDDESSSQAWVDDFCSAASDWRTSLEDAAGEIQSPSDLSADAIRGAIDSGLDATESFLDDIRSLGTPETEAGQEAKGIVDDMASTIETTVDDLRTAFDGNTDSLQELIGKVTQAGTQISAMAQELQGSVDQLGSLEGGELSSELQSNEDCDSARSGS